MSAEELRQAAETLRAMAKAATPGPWGVAEHWGLDDERAYVISEADVSNYVSAGGGIDEDADAPYIATMHPGVGLALADWLDREAGELGDFLNLDHPAMRLARLINGGAS